MDDRKQATIKLMPPYVKAGTGEFIFDITEELTLRQLAERISREWKDRLIFDLIDRQGNLTAEFILNGKYPSPEHPVDDGDYITIIPYIGGG